MYITQFKITNYKSFLDASPVTLKQGFNVFTARNNVGKTALAEALAAYHSINHPHISQITKPNAETTLSGPSLVDLNFSVYQNEVRQILAAPGTYFIPLVALESMADTRYSYNQILNSPEIEFRSVRRSNNNIIWNTSLNTVLAEASTMANVHGANVNVGLNNEIVVSQLVMASLNNVNSIYKVVDEVFRRCIYVFRAERLNLPMCNVGNNRTLASDAANLAEVLQNLQATPKLFARFNETLRTVLPQIYEVGVRTISSSQAEIVVFQGEHDSEREDLAIRLADCGTGIGQVLAMLYVVITSTSPRIIIIDEPNSFLHPGAVRNLFEVLREYPQHQFIITTHSPTVIAASNPSTLTLIRQENGISDFYPIDPSQTEQLREALVLNP